MARKKPDTTKVSQNTIPASLTASNPNEFPIVYGDDIWDVVAGGSSLATLIGNTGQYDQHSINEVLANTTSVASNIHYEYDTTESVFDSGTNKGIPSVGTTYVKVPSYYYTMFDNTEIVEGVPVPLNPPVNSFSIPITACGNCPIVQVVQDGHVVFCDLDINIGTGVITINWGDTITVNTQHPLYISVIG